MTKKDVVILSWQKPAHSDDNARKIAEFCGAEVDVISLAAAPDAASLKQSIPQCIALIVHLDTLVQIAGELRNAATGLLTLTDLARHVFIYGVGSTDRHCSILRVLSSGSLTAIRTLPTPDPMFRISDTHRELCGPFTGLSVRSADPERDACFDDGPAESGKTVLIRAAGRTFFASNVRAGSDLFFVACDEMGDLDEIVPWQPNLLHWFSRLVPLMIFLRKAFGNRIWHTDHARACIIIDDPLLRKRYGFLDYSQLLESIDKHRFSVSVAFIPWNYRRSHKRIADLFLKARPLLSLSIHGCDHTGSEFAETAFAVLHGKSRLALARMCLHSEHSGLPFDDVMVFPQGQFSSQALKALNCCGYLAAISTDPIPSDMPQAVTLRHLMDVANVSFGDFPLFGRHYPREAAEFAFDLFLGKPALVVEHHSYFQKGCESLSRFVRKINDLDERIEWSNLGTICSDACLKRVNSQGVVCIRFYSTRFMLVNSRDRATTYLLSCRCSGLVPDVVVNGRRWPVEQRDQSLTFSVSLDPGQRAGIRVCARESGSPSAVWKPRYAYRTTVLTRRLLSEFRDNHVATNRLLAVLLAAVYKFRSRRPRYGPRAVPQNPKP